MIYREIQREIKIDRERQIEKDIQIDKQREREINLHYIDKQIERDIYKENRERSQVQR